MRELILGAVLLLAATTGAARADTLATLDASQVAAQRLTGCFDRNFTPGADKPVDSPAAQKRLLATCATDWQAAAEACHTATGNPLKDCRQKTGKLADDYLGLKGAGIQ